MCKTISIMTPCFNEGANVEELYNRVRAEMCQAGALPLRMHIFIDNSSRDNTVATLKRIAAARPQRQRIVNARNFEHRPLSDARLSANPRATRSSALSPTFRIHAGADPANDREMGRGLS